MGWGSEGLGLGQRVSELRVSGLGGGRVKVVGLGGVWEGGAGRRVPVQLIHVMLDGVKGAGISVVTVVSSHASNVSGERREGGAYEDVCVDDCVCDDNCQG